MSSFSSSNEILVLTSEYSAESAIRTLSIVDLCLEPSFINLAYKLLDLKIFPVLLRHRLPGLFEHIYLNLRIATFDLSVLFILLLKRLYFRSMKPYPLNTPHHLL